MLILCDIHIHLPQLADDPEKGEEFYESVTCTACGNIDLVNPENGNVLGDNDD